MRVDIKLLKTLPNLLTRKLYISSDFVKKPNSATDVISDLFIWRSNNLWQTYFELLDIYGLISCELVGSPEREANIVFFDKNGNFLFEKIVKGNIFARNTLNINDLLTGSNLPKSKLGEYGTFAVFHSIDKSIEPESLLTDRGYCGYEINNSNFRGYVHGNFDAIAQGEKQTEFLMGYGRLSRPYNLQHILRGPSTYEVALVNPANTTQKIKIIISKEGKKSSLKTTLASGGISITSIPVLESEIARVKIISKMYMARPTVFRYTKDSMDVFHG